MLPADRKYHQFQLNPSLQDFSRHFWSFLAPSSYSDGHCKFQRLVRHHGQGRGGTWESTRSLVVLRSTVVSSEGNNFAWCLGVDSSAHWRLPRKFIPAFLQAVGCTPLSWPRDALQIPTSQTTDFSLSTCPTSLYFYLHCSLYSHLILPCFIPLYVSMLITGHTILYHIFCFQSICHWVFIS